MAKRMLVGTCLLALGIAIPAVTEAQTTTRTFDETELDVHLWNRDPEHGYTVRVNGYFYGVGSSQDAIRVDVRHGRTSLVSTRCSFDALDGDCGRLSCETDPEHTLTQTGDITVDLVFIDDVAETSTVIRTLNLNVRGYPYWVRNDGSRSIMGTMYQVDGSDLLGTAFTWMEHPSLRQTQTDESQRVFFYTAYSGSYAEHPAVLRCRVGDVRIPDRDLSARNYADYGVDERLSSTSDTRHVGWYRTRYEPRDLWWGTRIPLPPTGTGYDPTSIVFLGEHPGDWSCDVRSEGNVLRTFRFTVDASGYIVAHGTEGSAGMPAMLPGLHIADVRLPASGGIDDAIDPAAIRAGFQYGTPWLPASAVTEMLAALPAARGSSAPTAAGRGRGRH